VLHELAGRPLIDHVLDRAREVAPPGRISVVLGHGRDAVIRHLEGTGVVTVVQEPQLGTGDALRVGLDGVPDTAEAVLVLSGDVPLLQAGTLSRLMASVEGGAAAAVLTAVLKDGGSYGRVLRGRDGSLDRIVEARDATAAERAVREVNAGVYAFRTTGLAARLARLGTDNDQGECYLTDVVGLLREEGHPVEAVVLEDADEMLGVNDRADLARVAAVLNRRVVEALMASGVTIVDPSSTWVEPGCVVEPDAVLEPGVVLRDGARVGGGARIGAHSVVCGTVIAPGEAIPPLTRRSS
jgi:bifunctional UDP-N-acetylglucosamine pyrophosphorylase/glucosamine-1-phosphate N-acetyltransferase